MQPHTLLVHILFTSLASASVLQGEARQAKEERGLESPLAVRGDCQTNCLLKQSFCQSGCPIDPKTRTINVSHHFAPFFLTKAYIRNYYRRIVLQGAIGGIQTATVNAMMEVLTRNVT